MKQPHNTKKYLVVTVKVIFFWNTRHIYLNSNIIKDLSKILQHSHKNCVLHLNNTFITPLHTKAAALWIIHNWYFYFI